MFRVVLVLLHLSIHVLSNDIVQPEAMKVVQLGANVSFFCRYNPYSVRRVAWCKQPFGKEPLLMVSSVKHAKRNDFFNNFTRDFEETQRMAVIRRENAFDLQILKTEAEDSATYYCLFMDYNKVTFGAGTVLIVKGSDSKELSIVQNPVSESVQPGDSVTLNCTIYTETCAGEHSVYWFRHGAGESHPGILYTHGNRSDMCEKSPEAQSPTQSCVYKLLKRNLALSDAGTYYCAVASCGEILFGDGSSLIIKYMPVLLIDLHVIIITCLTALLITSMIANVALYLKMETSHIAPQDQCGAANVSLENEQVPDGGENIHYAALKYTESTSDRGKRKRSERTEDTTCIYSRVNSSRQEVKLSARWHT